MYEADAISQEVFLFGGSFMVGFDKSFVLKDIIR